MAAKKAYLSAKSSNSVHLIRKTLHELNQATQRDSRWTFGDPGLLILHPGRARDVEMNPRSVFGELFQEHGRVDGAAPASPRVYDVSDARLDIVFVFVIERQPPHLFSSFFIRFVEAFVHGIVVGEDPRVGI